MLPFERNHSKSQSDMNNGSNKTSCNNVENDPNYKTRPVTIGRSENLRYASQTQCDYIISDINRNKTKQNIKTHKHTQNKHEHIPPPRYL